MYTEPKRAHYEEQFEHNEKVGRRICCCHLPMSKIIGDDLGENGKIGEGQHQPRLLFESSVPRGKTPEDTYFFYLLFVRLIAWVTVAKKKPQLATCSVATMLRKTILMIIIILGLIWTLTNNQRGIVRSGQKHVSAYLWKYKNSDVKRKLDQLLLCNINVSVEMDFKWLWS